MIRVAFAKVIGDLAAVDPLIITIPRATRLSSVGPRSHPVGCPVCPAVRAIQPACRMAVGTCPVSVARKWKRLTARHVWWVLLLNSVLTPVVSQISGTALWRCLRDPNRVHSTFLGGSSLHCFSPLSRLGVCPAHKQLFTIQSNFGKKKSTLWCTFSLETSRSPIQL